MITPDRSARYHLTPDKSQRLFNLLAKRKGAKDRLIKQADQQLAPQFDLAQQLTNAGADPEEVRNLQYLDPATAWRLAPVAQEWARQGDVGQLSNLAAGSEAQRELMQNYMDRGWADPYTNWFGQKGLGPLERFGVNAWRGGGQALDQASLAHGYQAAVGQLQQKLEEQGLDPETAMSQARLMMPNQREFEKQVAGRLYQEGQGGGAINAVAPFLTGWAFPAAAGWNVARTLGGDAFRGEMGNQEAADRTQSLYEAAQRSADTRGGATLWSDLGATAGLAAKVPGMLLSMSDPQTATVEAARGATSLLSGGQDYTQRMRDLELKKLRRAQEQWDAKNLTESRYGAQGALTREGGQARLMRDSGLQPSTGQQGLSRDVEVERTAPYRNIWGTFDGLPAYLGLAKDKSEYDYAKGDVMGTGLNVLSNSGANPIIAHARNLRDMVTGRDSTYDRLRELSKEGDPRLQGWNRVQQAAEQGKYDLGTLNQVQFRRRGSAEQMPFWNVFADPNRYGEVAGADFGKFLDSDFWKQSQKQLAEGSMADPHAQQLMSYYQNIQDPTMKRQFGQNFMPLYSQWQANRGTGQSRTWSGDYWDRTEAKQPQTPQAPQAPTPPAGGQPTAQAHQMQPSNMPKAAALRWAKTAGPGQLKVAYTPGSYVELGDIATSGPPVPGVDQKPTPAQDPQGPILPGGVREMQRRIERPALSHPGQMTRQDWIARRRNAALTQYHLAPENRRQYYSGKEERWSRPGTWQHWARPFMSQQDEWAADPVIQRHRAAVRSGQWEPGMQIDQLVNRGTFGWSNPLGGLSRWIGLANPEAESEEMLSKTRGSSNWKSLLSQYEQGLISREQLARVAPAALARMQAPEQGQASLIKNRYAHRLNVLRDAAREADLREKHRREMNPMEGM